MPKTLLSRRRVLAGAAGLSAAAILPRSSLADWKPTENVRIIVPAAAGGSTDVMGRLLAAHLQTAWGQSAVVENRSGGGGTIGTAEAVRAKPDGHTILIGNPGPNAIAYSIFKNLTYKPDQLQPVSNMIRIPNIVSAHPKTGIKSVAELIAYLKTNPDKLSYASSGVGQSPHLTGAWFLQLTGLKMTHIPFRGAGPALQAALAGDIQILFDNLYPSLPQVQNGTLTGLCVTTTDRSDLAPNLPTMRESAPELAQFRRVVVVLGVSAEGCAARRAGSAQPSGQGDAGARRHQEEHRRHGRPRRLRHPAAVRRLRGRRDEEVRRHHPEGRPADGRAVGLVSRTRCSVQRCAAENADRAKSTNKNPAARAAGFFRVSLAPFSARGSPAAARPRCS
ncbi:tripartite-type tricarboxylate transporter receptor subunit TctC [Bradyrhizobium japonicum]